MSIKNNNLYEINENIQAGQKVIRFSKNVWIPVGFNTSGGNNPVPVEGSEVQLGVVDENGKFQLLSFEGTNSVESGIPQTVDFYKSWNRPSDMEEPEIPGGGSSGDTMTEIDLFDWQQILSFN